MQGALDRRAVAALVTAAVAGVLASQFGNPETWLAWTGAGRGVRSLFAAELWQASVVVSVYILLPLVVARAFGLGPRALGLRLGDARRFVRTALVAVVVAAPIILALSFTTTFRHVYPVFAPAVLGGRVLAAWLILVALMLFAVELFYRGFLLTMLEPALGRLALFVMIVPYALTHRDVIEALGAVAVGLGLGELALRSRSIWMGWVTHTAIAWTIELIAVWQARR